MILLNKTTKDTLFLLFTYIKYLLKFLLNFFDFFLLHTLNHFTFTVGIKYQSNLNEIGKSEQKLMGDTPKGYDWSKDKQSSAAASSSILTITSKSYFALLPLHRHHECLALILMLRFVWLKFWNLKET